MNGRIKAERIFVGTAGWNIPRDSAFRFSPGGTHLQRYARLLRCAEINSSFHRPHSSTTYAKWAACTPPDFRFSVKLPRIITHDRRLRRARLPLQRFLQESSGLGNKRGPLLVQLPPSLFFEARVVRRFFALLRNFYPGPAVCEPRHETWLSPAANALMVDYRVARVAADPPASPGLAEPGGWRGTVYFRLHGSPRKYWSPYTDDFVDRLAGILRAAAASTDVWCVFDNTASGAAAENACGLLGRLCLQGRRPRPIAG